MSADREIRRHLHLPRLQLPAVHPVHVLPLALPVARTRPQPHEVLPDQVPGCEWRVAWFGGLGFVLWQSQWVLLDQGSERLAMGKIWVFSLAFSCFSSDRFLTGYFKFTCQIRCRHKLGLVSCPIYLVTLLTHLFLTKPCFRFLLRTPPQRHRATTGLRIPQENHFKYE